MPRAEVQECDLSEGVKNHFSFGDTAGAMGQNRMEGEGSTQGALRKTAWVQAQLYYYQLWNLGQVIQPLCASVSVWVLVKIKGNNEFGTVLGTL